MEIIEKKVGDMAVGGVFRTFWLIFIFFFSTIHVSPAQEAGAVTLDTVKSVTDESAGPSLENISKNLANSAKELEKIRHQEIMSYIYMALGFSVVIGIAWFTTVLARKRKKKEDDVRAIRMQRMQHTKHKLHPRR